MDDNKSVRQVIEDVCETMCMNYCRYSNGQGTPLDNGEYGYVECENCPLDKLN